MTQLQNSLTPRLSSKLTALTRVAPTARSLLLTFQDKKKARNLPVERPYISFWGPRSLLEDLVVELKCAGFVDLYKPSRFEMDENHMQFKCAQILLEEIPGFAFADILQASLTAIETVSWRRNWRVLRWLTHGRMADSF